MELMDTDGLNCDSQRDLLAIKNKLLIKLVDIEAQNNPSSI